MLEPTEPIEGSEPNTPSDTLPPRRRRRAASRPAGPPTAAEGAVENSAPAIPADVSDEKNDEVAAVEAPAVVEGAVAEEAAPAGRTRRRATRRVSAPAGAPEANEVPEAAGIVVPAVAAAAPAAVEEAAPTAEPVEDAAPPRTRRRATRRVTAPEAEVAEVPEVAVVAEAPAVVEDVEEEAVAEEVAPVGRTRRRATRRVSTPAGAPEASDVPEAVESVEATSVTEEVTEGSAAAGSEEDAGPRRSRRRATRRVSAPAGTPVGEEAPVNDETPADTAETSTPAEAPVEDSGPRRRRRAVRTAAGGFSAPAPKSGNAAEDEDGPRRPRRPAVAVFQAPVFTEPMFQTPERAAAAAAAEAADDEDEDEDEIVVVAEPVPVVVEAVEEETGGRRRRRRRGAAFEAEPEAPVVVEAVVEEESDEPEEAEDSADGDEAEETGSRRRRRRGGRRRRRGESATGEDEGEDGDEYAAEQAAQADQDAEDTAEQIEEDAEDADEDQGGSGSSSSRRRRRRRRRAGDSGGESESPSSTDDPERTVVKVREPRAKKDEHPSDEVQSIKGSTRLEAKKQRRREGREQGRRRVPIITEAEFLARREAVERVMVVRQSGERTQIGVLEDGVLVEHYVNKEQSTSYVGNVYLGKVQNVLPSMEAAFIDIGKGRNAVLYAGEVNFEALGMANGPRRIESALKSGQSVLVQVTKDPIGHKGARLTSQVSLPGRYLVYVPEGSMTGISRKLPDTERARLKTILKKIVPEDAGVIVRTAAEGASEDELSRDVERLQAQWEDIQKKSKGSGGSNAPTLLYGEPDMTVRVVRDIFNEDFTKVIVSGDEAWDTIHGYVSHVAPDLADRLSRWTSEVDVFATYRIDEQLMKALDRKVWLPSGGSLVIDKTEAMIVIDVNTGKFTGQGGNLEETVTRNNLEAAEEIVRQLRLRDLGGIVVIDFIDMVLESNRDLVLRRLLECLGRDRTKHQVAEVTSLGLVQMTRKRVGQGLLESFSETCVHCNGRGVIVHMEQPTSVGGGGKRKRRGRGGDGGQDAHDTHDGHETHEHDHESDEVETEAEVAAEVAMPVPFAESEFRPDEDLYSSAAEAEAAATRGGRSRRRTSRRASAPAGAPRAESRESRQPREVHEVREEAEPVSVAQAAPVAVEDPVVEAPAVQETPAPVVEAPAVEAPVVDDAAPKGRTRRRATRKATAPAGSPAGSEEAAVVTVTEAAAPVVVEAPAPAAEAEQPEAPAESAAPARPRRRAVRKATAPTASEEAAVTVVPSAVVEEAPVVEVATGAEADAGAEVEADAPAKRTAARKAAKKAPAKKAVAKKAAATKTAAKKTVAKKTTAKKAAKTTSKKTAAAEQTSPSAVTASTDEG
ncbi:ribonuclease E/G [Streptomyces sp. NPDC101776]|uniref:Rne/Rng family ribonuclease n=1 Tax=Streptomyces sp. NPDC101776 TaxID=3366146 RepID=UPI00382EAB5E